MTQDWWGRADCKGEDPETFFAFGADFGGRTVETAAATQEAKKICRPCPVRKECLDWAIGNEDYGVWGGTTAYERRKIREKRAEEAAVDGGGMCPNGHERTAEHVRVDRRGRAFCRTCTQERGFTTAMRVAARETRALKNCCVNGHELAGDNVYRDARGHRNCRRCKADRMARTRAQRRREVSHAH